MDYPCIGHLVERIETTEDTENWEETYVYGCLVCGMRYIIYADGSESDVFYIITLDTNGTE